MNFENDIRSVQQISVVPAILDLICRTTGMGYAAVARVTEGHWVACAVRDDVAFGLKPGDELPIERTFCDTVRRGRKPVVFDHASADPTYCVHPLPKAYGIESYISMPIILPDGRFFGTLCGIGIKPALVHNPQVMGSVRLYADLIAMHLDSLARRSAAEALLAEEREEAAARERFIAILGHDLRNPLSALAAGTRMLQAAPTTGDAQQVAGLMFATLGRMGGLIENVLDFARARMGGGITVERTRTADLEPTLRHVADEMHAIEPGRDIELRFDLAMPAKVDTQRVAQLFANLLGNALSHGAAEAPVRVEARSDATGVTLAIANAGPRIPDAVRDRLFLPFSRGDVGAGREGLGLGLYIASEIARAHGGTIDYVSDSAETRFTVRLPA